MSFSRPEFELSEGNYNHDEPSSQEREHSALEGSAIVVFATPMNPVCLRHTDQGQAKRAVYVTNA